MRRAIALSGFTIQIANRGRSAPGNRFPAGSSILPPQKWLPPEPRNVAAELGTRFHQRGRWRPTLRVTLQKSARIGVWVPWADTDSIGWIRYSLDQRKVPYTYLRDEDIRAGSAAATTSTSCSTAMSTSNSPNNPGPAQSLGAHAFKKTRKSQPRHPR